MRTNQEIRLYQNSVKFDDFISEIGMQYAINKNFEIAGDIRYIYNRTRTDTYENNFRYNCDFSFSKKIIKRLKFDLRFRYQTEYVNLFAKSDPEQYSFTNVRSRFKLIYKMSDMHRFYLSGEAFRLIENYSKPYYNKWIFYFGDDMEWNKHCLNLSIGYEQEINNPSPYFFIMGRIIYEFSLQ